MSNRTPLAAHVEMHALCPLYAVFPGHRFDFYIPVPERGQRPQERRRGCPLANAGSNQGPRGSLAPMGIEAGTLQPGDTALVEVLCNSCRAETGGRQQWIVEAPVIVWPTWR